MSRKIIIALSALVAAGCFFGGESDTPTSLNPDPKPQDSLPKIKSLKPGLYVSNYDWFDSTKQGLESEFRLDAGGTFSHLFIIDNEAWIAQKGQWFQRDSGLYFSNLEETQASGGLLSDYIPMENDTNGLLAVTDTSFQRREWTPLRIKPIWITYTKKTFPQIADGDYRLSETFGEGDAAVKVDFEIKLANKGYLLSVSENDINAYQESASFSQSGSFLVLDAFRYRVTDSANVFGDWIPVTGSILARIEKVSNTSFDKWVAAGTFNLGYWESYLRIP